MPIYAISDLLLLNAVTEHHPQSAAVPCFAVTHPVSFNAVDFGDTDEVAGAVRGAVSRIGSLCTSLSVLADAGCFTKQFCVSSAEM